MCYILWEYIILPKYYIIFRVLEASEPGHLLTIWTKLIDGPNPKSKATVIKWLTKPRGTRPIKKFGRKKNNMG